MEHFLVTPIFNNIQNSNNQYAIQNFTCVNNSFKCLVIFLNLANAFAIVSHDLLKKVQINNIRVIATKLVINYLLFGANVVSGIYQQYI